MVPMNLRLAGGRAGDYLSQAGNLRVIGLLHAPSILSFLYRSFV